MAASQQHIKVLSEQKKQIGEKVIDLEQQLQLKGKENEHLRNDVADLQKTINEKDVIIHELSQKSTEKDDNIVQLNEKVTTL